MATTSPMFSTATTTSAKSPTSPARQPPSLKPIHTLDEDDPKHDLDPPVRAHTKNKQSSRPQAPQRRSTGPPKSPMSPTFHPSPPTSPQERSMKKNEPVLVSAGSSTSSKLDPGSSEIKASNDIQMPSPSAFQFTSILSDIDAETNGSTSATIDVIAGICGRSNLSLADEHTKHLPPQGLATGSGKRDNRNGTNHDGEDEEDRRVVQAHGVLGRMVTWLMGGGDDVNGKGKERRQHD